MSIRRGAFSAIASPVLLREINPQAVAVRADTTLRERAYYSDGPNDVWHYDQNDKLKPFGIPLHSAVDGYSRFILWMAVVPSNNNPRVIVHHYLNAVESLRGCPRITRSDHGSENNHAAGAQRMFRFLQLPDEQFWQAWNSHIWGKSTNNTRIESAWSRLKSQGLAFWRHPLQLLERDGYLRNDKAIQILQRMIVPLIQKWLDRLRRVWNRHRIRRSRKHVIPGAPIRLFTAPLLPAGNCKEYVSPEQISAAREAFCPDQDIYTLWHSDADRVVVDAAIERECALQGIRSSLIDYDNWQPIFKNIIRQQIEDEVKNLLPPVPLRAPSDQSPTSPNNEDSMGSKTDTRDASELSDLQTTDIHVPRYRPLYIAGMNKPASKVRKYRVAWGPNEDTVFAVTWENEQWFLGEAERFDLLQRYEAADAQSDDVDNDDDDNNNEIVDDFDDRSNSAAAKRYKTN